jgi:DNA mismatch repair protein MutL
MPIQLLSPQLANQIAAGEVVERPASVVKEVVENALDAGATSLWIDIEKGGCRLINIRDNGAGIAKDELALALSRHATSKISELDDLAHIMSLGFRGEALASISSVSRLTLTSKPAAQDSAWQAKAEGRDMAVQILPAAHPNGTTVSVQDLFFNTPARRRFLRSEKTEFSHIEELIKKLALSRFDVAFQLTHNGSVVRQLPLASQQQAKEKRLALLCGRAFMQQVLYVEAQYEGMQLSGWLQHAASCTSQPSCQYSYVNGRMMRDKLLNHAIRQAYGDRIAAGAQPAFVLYLSLDPAEVDVNVHPAKHEVRFHQARLVHDFIASALQDALQQAQQLAFDTSFKDGRSSNPAPFSDDEFAERQPQPSVLPPTERADIRPPAPAASADVFTGHERSLHQVKTSPSHRYNSGAMTGKPAGRASAAARFSPYPAKPQGWLMPSTPMVPVPTADYQPLQAAGDQHASPLETSPQDMSAQNTSVQNLVPSAASSNAVLTDWLWLNHAFAMTRVAGHVVRVNVAETFSRWWIMQPPVSQTLLMPIRLKIGAHELPALLCQAQQLSALGFDLLVHESVVIIRAVPILLKQTAIAQWLPLWWQHWPANVAQTEHQLLMSLWTVLLPEAKLTLDKIQHAFAAIASDPTHWSIEPIPPSCIALLLSPNFTAS